MDTTWRQLFGVSKEVEGKSLIEYKGYVGKVVFDNDAGLFHGEVINIRDVITFQGESVSEIRQAFEDSVEDYLEFCAERGENPEKPFSGRFMVRMHPELHQAVSFCAKKEDMSINKLVILALEKAILDMCDPEDISAGFLNDNSEAVELREKVMA